MSRVPRAALWLGLLLAAQVVIAPPRPGTVRRRSLRMRGGRAAARAADRVPSPRFASTAQPPLGV